MTFTPDTDLQTGASDFNQKEKCVCDKVPETENAIMVKWPGEEVVLE